jgi:hypothetical protein
MNYYFVSNWTVPRKAVALSVSFIILDMSLKHLINLGPIYREKSGEDIDKQL